MPSTRRDYVVLELGVQGKVKESAASIQHMDDLIHLLPSLLFVHLAKIGLFEEVYFVPELPQNQKVLAEYFCGRLKRRYDDLLLAQSELLIR